MPSRSTNTIPKMWSLKASSFLALNFTFMNWFLVAYCTRCPCLLGFQTWHKMCKVEKGDRWKSNLDFAQPSNPPLFPGNGWLVKTSPSLLAFGRWPYSLQGINGQVANNRSTHLFGSNPCWAPKNKATNSSKGPRINWLFMGKTCLSFPLLFGWAPRLLVVRRIGCCLSFLRGLGWGRVALDPS